MGFVDYILANPAEFLKLIRQHLVLVGVAGAFTIAIGLPLGVTLTRPRFQRVAESVVGVVNIGQSVPSLAVVGLAMGLLGLGFRPAAFALFLYGLLPVVRNTMTGILEVPAAVIEAARGMGMTAAQVLLRIELPLAMRVILAGIRVSLVVNVGTAALAFLIGGGGLGDLIFTGIALMDTPLVLAGAVPTAILAVVLDALMGLVERVAAPAV
ncbi:MAG: ABC transporter permease [Bacillota bacterium]|nr:ABC transporter permease [Bacillota bacterium]